jgi:putative metalloenzyme radical SAM/SPASM domain maturase
LTALCNAKRICNRPEVSVGIEYVVMQKNLLELPAALRWAARQGVSFAIVSHVLPYEEQHAGQSSYSLHSAETLEMFKRYSLEASMQGLDMSKYFDARWKYARDKDEQLLVDLVNAMKTEAGERNLFLDMKKLLMLDARRDDEIREVFRQARQVAEECEIDLQLPEITVSDKRHCSFVEDGGAFVSVEGNLSPCYFLWHRYSCFASGWKQQVTPRVFGNVSDQDIMEIWNSAEYRDFRNQVTAYDYPGCSSCSLAPCDYVQTENFEQDCHIGSVPCGACLWCTGVFQCLS